MATQVSISALCYSVLLWSVPLGAGTNTQQTHHVQARSYEHGRRDKARVLKNLYARAAFATLAYHPEGDLLDRLAHHAASIVRTFRPQATSNSLWAFAKLAYVPCQLFLTTSASQARPLEPACKDLGLG